QFQNERMIAAYTAVGAMDRALSLTAAHLRDRRTFGEPLLSRQYVQFRLAELAAEVDTLRHYNYACAEAYMRGEDTPRFATIAKLKAGRLQREIADTCLQFHGGLGYMEETWVSRYFRDSRLLSIGGGGRGGRGPDPRPVDRVTRRAAAPPTPPCPPRRPHPRRPCPPPSSSVARPT